MNMTQSLLTVNTVDLFDALLCFALEGGGRLPRDVMFLKQNS